MRFEQITEGDPHQRVSVCEKRHIEPMFYGRHLTNAKGLFYN